jgi:hypothetical protein
MIGRFAHWGVLAAAAASLAGCGLPPAIALMGYAADGLSYATTGKSTTDHALSAAIDRDCSLLRAAYDEPVCRKSDKNRRDEKAARDAAMTAYAASSDEVAPGVVLLSADADSDESDQIAWLPPGEDGDEVAELAAQTAEAHELNEVVPAAAPAPAAAAPERLMPTPLIPLRPAPPVAESAVPASSDEWMLVLGSYHDAIEAGGAVRRFLAFRPMVVNAKVDGHVWRRVVSGPYDSVQLASARQRAREAGAQDAWGARLCPGAAEARCVAREAITPPLPRP